jgi:predicted dienelactone hydrolase
MPRSPFTALVAATALCLGAALPAEAADCNGRHAAGYRVLDLHDGRKLAVWYPTSTPEQRGSGRGFASRVARDAPPASCPRMPLVLFSHGWGGCALQSIFLTEELARNGYVVAAPDHADATCAIGADTLDLGRLRIDSSFFDPASWSDRSQVGRLHDLRAAISRVAADRELAAIVDTARVGAAGHSLGGYAVIAMAGGWPTWKTPGIGAVLALSPYLLPFLARDTLGRLQAPVMYQGGSLDWGLTTSLEGAQGAYARTAPPKFFVKLDGATHLEWTNLSCDGLPDAIACVAARPNVALIVRYATAFFDRYLKDKRDDALTATSRGLASYRFELK